MIGKASKMAHHRVQVPRHTLGFCETGWVAIDSLVCTMGTHSGVRCPYPRGE